MNTPTHMLIGAALFARKDYPSVSAAALVGGLAPDIPLLVMVAYATRIAGIPQQQVYTTLFFSERWQQVFAIDHSFFVWGALIAVGIVFHWKAVMAFAGAGLAHAAVDFLTHHDDARRQFWPVSDWVFKSPVSYWDQAYYGGLVAPLEAVLVVVLTFILLRRLDKWRERIPILAVAALLLAPIILTGGFHGLHGVG
ncbi:MAG: hypothetical protein ABJN75_10130 [Hoeflea sp.]|uniref:hypothetical protein n=1 Tax=Hoeflea sp. TaxID=1940281 RepID=UPI003297D90C